MAEINIRETLRELPSVESLLANTACDPWIEKYGRERLRDALRDVLDNFRKVAVASKAETISRDMNHDHWIKAAAKQLEETFKPGPRKVVNCSGVIVHTNIGRSVMAGEAASAAYNAALGNINIEYRLDGGERGERDEVVERLFVELACAEAATVVNNNAAAVLLALNTLSDGKETIVSRGELIEIGGSFRLPEVMRKSGCILKEIGATNKTHLSDYEEAINENTALILRAHTSNYRIVGFTSQPSLKELSAFAKSKDLPLMVDLGSGALIDLEPFGVVNETTVSETLQNGADIVTVSGDKLLGGPQAGIIAGDRELIRLIRKNHLKRALRCDKMTLAALEATLRLYLNPDTARTHIPTLRHLGRPVEEIRPIARKAASALQQWLGENAEVFVMDDMARAGGGSAPEVDIPSVSVAIRHKTMGPNKLAEMFRKLDPPIIGRVDDDLFRLDMRCVDNVDNISESLPK